MNFPHEPGGAKILVDAVNNQQEPDNTINVLQLDFRGGGNFTYTPNFTANTGVWGFTGTLSAGAFSQNGNVGATGSFTSADGKTVTVSGGIIISIV